MAARVMAFLFNRVVDRCFCYFAALAGDNLCDGKHDLTVIHEIVTPYDNHVPVNFIFHMFLLLSC